MKSIRHLCLINVLCAASVVGGNVFATTVCDDAFRPVELKKDANESASDLEADLFAPFVAGFDSVFERIFRANPVEGLSFQTVEYDAPLGYEVKDDGFLPAFKNLGRTHRVLTYENSKLTIDRDPSVEFLNEVRGHVVKAALSKYQGVIPEPIIKAVERAEDKLPSSQSAIGIVRDQESGLILGTIRIFHGIVSRGKIVLPSTQVLRELGSMTEEFDKKLIGLAYGREVLPEMSYDYPLRSLIEVGQLSINATLPPEKHEAVRNLLFRWVETRLQESKSQLGQIQEPLVIAHVAGRKHAVLYRRQFGIKDVIFTVPNPAKSEDQESVLSIEAGRAIENSAKTRTRKD